MPSYERALPHLLQLDCDVLTIEACSSDGKDLALFSKYNIVTARVAHEEYDGLRITPHIYSTVADIDIFADAVEKELKNA